MSEINPPLLIICFGVSGCGKSTVASFLAKEFNLQYIEADDFHSKTNKDHMAAGKPLTDEMREPWIMALSEHLTQQKALAKSCIMANSCLRKAHRQRYRTLGFKTVFIHLTGEKSLIAKRMQARSDHFMPTSLLDSQFEALECSELEKDVVPIAINTTSNVVCQTAAEFIRSTL